VVLKDERLLSWGCDSAEAVAEKKLKTRTSGYESRNGRFVSTILATIVNCLGGGPTFAHTEQY
jgi:hypothetical protein